MTRRQKPLNLGCKIFTGEINRAPAGNDEEIRASRQIAAAAAKKLPNLAFDSIAHD